MKITPRHGEIKKARIQKKEQRLGKANPAVAFYGVCGAYCLRPASGKGAKTGILVFLPRRALKWQTLPLAKMKK